MANPSVADISSQKFGRLTVVKRVDAPVDRVPKYSHWECKCDCGNTVMVSRKHLGRSVHSCGCLRREHMRNVATKHGHAGADHGEMSSEYRSWLAMKNRCYYESNPKYAIYGGRGIAVCDRWKEDFSAFLSDMGQKPTGKHTIDRIDPDGNYEPGNCRWATQTEQRHNRRK